MSLFKVPEKAYQAAENGYTRRSGLENAAPYIAHAAIRGLISHKATNAMNTADFVVRNLDLFGLLVLLVLLDGTPYQLPTLGIMGLRLLSLVIDKVWWAKTRRMAGILSRRDVNDYR